VSRLAEESVVGRTKASITSGQRHPTFTAHVGSISVSSSLCSFFVFSSFSANKQKKKMLIAIFVLRQAPPPRSHRLYR